MPYTHHPGHPLYLAETHLRACDPLFERCIPKHGPCALLDRKGCYLHVLIKTIIDQQLAVKAAAQIAARLQKLHGGAQFSAEGLLALSAAEMREAGLSRFKANAIHGIATAVVQGKLCFQRLENMSDADAVKELRTFAGIGPWTAEVFLMFALGRLDVLPLGDLGLRNAIKRHYALGERPALAEYSAVAEKWRPYRSVASWYLWAAVDG